MPALRCAAAFSALDLLHLEDHVRQLRACGIEEIHFTLANGSAATRLGDGVTVLKALAQAGEIPCHVHLVSEQPDRHIDALAKAGCAGVTVQAEVLVHGHRTLSQISEAGMKAGVALYPASSLTDVGYLLPLADRVTLLATEPGPAKPKYRMATAERVRIVSENIRYHEYRCDIAVSGGLTTQHAAACARLGANILVLDNPGHVSNAESFAAFLEAVDRQMKLV